MICALRGVIMRSQPAPVRARPRARGSREFVQKRRRVSSSSNYSHELSRLSQRRIVALPYARFSAGRNIFSFCWRLAARPRGRSSCAPESLIRSPLPMSIGTRFSPADGHVTIISVVNRRDEAKAQSVGERFRIISCGDPKVRLITLVNFQQNILLPLRGMVSAVIRHRLDAEAKEVQKSYSANGTSTAMRETIFLSSPISTARPSRNLASADFIRVRRFCFRRHEAVWSGAGATCRAEEDVAQAHQGSAVGGRALSRAPCSVGVESRSCQQAQCLRRLKAAATALRLNTSAPLDRFRSTTRRFRLRDYDIFESSLLKKSERPVRCGRRYDIARRAMPFAAVRSSGFQFPQRDQARAVDARDLIFVRLPHVDERQRFLHIHLCLQLPHRN